MYRSCILHQFRMNIKISSSAHECLNASRMLYRRLLLLKRNRGETPERYEKPKKVLVSLLLFSSIFLDDQHIEPAALDIARNRYPLDQLIPASGMAYFEINDAVWCISSILSHPSKRYGAAKHRHRKSRRSGCRRTKKLSNRSNGGGSVVRSSFM